MGNVWYESISLTSWRQQLCLKQELYNTDATGQQAALFSAVQQQTKGAKLNTELVQQNLTSLLQSLRDSGTHNLVSISAAANTLNGSNQIVSVKSVCQNHGSTRVLLISWLLFGGCCLVVISAYLVGSILAPRATKSKLQGWAQSLGAIVSVAWQAVSGVGGLVFYYYDLVSSIVVLTQVWGKWPGIILPTIFFFHFAVIGAVVAFRGMARLLRSRRNLKVRSTRVFLGTAAVIVSPFMIPLILLLDTVTFVREVILFVKHGVRLPGLQCLQPGYVGVFKLQRFVTALNVLGLSWVDLKQYEDMHNLVAAVLQSLPTLVLNSVIFASGNKPSHGIFLSAKLFAVTTVASAKVFDHSILAGIQTTH